MKIVRNFVYICIIFLFYVLFVNFSKIEFIRSNYSDISFEFMNYFLFNKKENLKAPTIIIGAFDNKYMCSKSLFINCDKTYKCEKDNCLPHYGYIFPRRYIAKFINKLDRFTTRKHIHPKALFIDYNFDFTSAVYGKQLSKDDILFLKALAKKRDYIIFLPKTSNYSFIESLKNPKIQKLIKEGKIQFVSVSIAQNYDNVVRRYVTDTKIGSKTYESIELKVFKLDNNLSNNNNSIYKTDILFKNYITSNKLKSYENSYWNNMYKISVYNFFSSHIIRENLQNSIIFLGSTYKNNGDKYSIFNVLPVDLNGIEIQANALNTLYYFNGFIDTNFLVAFLIIILVYIFSKLSTKLYKKLFIKYKNSIIFILVFGILFLLHTIFVNLSIFYLILTFEVFIILYLISDKFKRFIIDFLNDKSEDNYYFILIFSFILSYVILTHYKIWIDYLIISFSFFIGVKTIEYINKFNIKDKK